MIEPLEPPRQQDTSNFEFWSWLNRLWLRATNDEQINASQLNPDGDAGHVFGIDEDGNAALLALEAGDGIKITVDGSTIKIEADVKRTNELLEKLLDETRVVAKLLQQGLNVKEEIDHLRKDEVRERAKEQ